MNNKNGFTIIELGVVVLLIGIISFGLTPFVKKVQNKARQRKCVRNLGKISIALRIYALENEESTPSTMNSLAEKGYVESDSVFDCPFSPEKGNADMIEYVYPKKVDFRKAENIPIVYDQIGNHQDGSINVLYVNGEIKKLKASEAIALVMKEKSG